MELPHGCSRRKPTSGGRQRPVTHWPRTYRSPPHGPRGSVPSLRNVEVGVARTLPALPQRSEVREVEALDLAAIAAARDVIYMENQYFASRSIAEAIAARLREEHGPEVVIILPRSSESRLEIESMDSARERLVRLLRKADLHGRLGVYWPAAGRGCRYTSTRRSSWSTADCSASAPPTSTTDRWASTANATSRSKPIPRSRTVRR